MKTITLIKNGISLSFNIFKAIDILSINFSSGYTPWCNILSVADVISTGSFLNIFPSGFQSECSVKTSSRANVS